MIDDNNEAPDSASAPPDGSHSKDNDRKNSDSKNKDKDSKEDKSNKSQTMSLLTKLIIAAVVLALLVAALIYFWPTIRTALDTVSTDDAYVDGHVTFVAARVAGQVSEVLVEDNNRVSKGDMLAKLDPTPFQNQVDIRSAAVVTAKADVVGSRAKVRAMIGQTRADLFNLQLAIEQVNDKVAKLRASIATYESFLAQLTLDKNNLDRGNKLVGSGAISEEEIEQRRQSVQVAQAQVEESLQEIYANRVSLGLPAAPPQDKPLDDAPDNINETFASVRVALANFIASAAQFGYYPLAWDATPRQAIELYYTQMADRNADALYTSIIDKSPDVVLSQAKLMQAERNLDQANLNLSYCTIISEIDGVVTRRNINPGNNVEVGQSLMAVRSLNDIWINANFKETQLRDLRIGQRVRLDVDMYGDKQEFAGRVTGFTMGTGQTLALLPPQNATGNFVKIVQRLPVRIDLENYDPAKLPLFVGLSVEPYVYFKEPTKGEDGGQYLQAATKRQEPTAATETEEP